MRPIPPAMREQMARDPYYSRCALLFTNNVPPCAGHIEWHHVWIYASKQINEPWAILPACRHHHGLVNQSSVVKEAFERLSLRRATPEHLASYPRKDWQQLKTYLGI